MPTLWPSGHVVQTCYHRFDPHYQSPAATPQNSVPYFNTQPRPPSSSFHQPRTYLTTAPTTSDSSWYIDLGASHHVTAEQSNILQHSDTNHGPELLYVTTKELLLKGKAEGGIYYFDNLVVLKNHKTKPATFPYPSAKMHQLPFLDSQTTYTAPLQLVYADIWGPAPFTSHSGTAKVCDNSPNQQGEIPLSHASMPSTITLNSLIPTTHQDEQPRGVSTEKPTSQAEEQAPVTAPARIHISRIEIV
ncbi:hypothetical protein PIB30_081550 [Stylosanthes scabra]|uniref:Uncharacterized protein n=1 Tax=Stylosanthes scabra TaxID=79078 RepID=A0ABU6UU22_9FABA|nr:hypothetical protein [Stylosanthes scabra]